MTSPEYRAELKGVFSNSAFIARRALMRSVARMAATPPIEPGMTWLDVGCGMRPYEPIFRAGRYIGIDVEQSGRAGAEKTPDLYYDGTRIPLDDASVDGVVSTQVLEHTYGHAALLDEARRVLKPGGALLLTLPFVWPQHEKPYDFFRFTEFSTRRLLEERGFEIVVFAKSTGSAETIAQLLSTYVASSLFSRLPFGRGVMVALICAPIQLLGLALQAVLPDDGDLYLDNAVLALKR